MGASMPLALTSWAAAASGQRLLLRGGPLQQFGQVDHCRRDVDVVEVAALRSHHRLQLLPRLGALDALGNEGCTRTQWFV